MPDFDKIEDTLFVPMLGRIYATEKYPNILSDKKAMELKAKLPRDIKGQDTQTEYTLMASAVRSVNMDRYIKDFMKRYEDGVIVQLGAGLETTYFRCDDGVHKWYEFDLPEVIEYRKMLLGNNENEECIAEDVLQDNWIKIVKKAHPTSPILVTASGLFYYFKHSDVLNIFKMLKSYGVVEVVFDTINKSGMKRMSKYMKQVGHADAEMFFYVDKIEEFKREIGAVDAIEEPYYKHVEKKGLKFKTAVTMKMSDLFKMVKMEHIKMN